MSPVRRHPPGRSGRLWLQRRLAAARQGSDLLDRKLRILLQEEERSAEQARATGATWAAACAEAERWLLRAAVVGGQRGVRPAQSAGVASVEVTWASVMGVRYPSGGRCEVPDDEPLSPVVASAALVVARTAYRSALEAAVAHAAAEAAARVVAAEVRTTRGRLRAVEQRWVPQLEDALRRLEAALQENETAEAVRLRWVAARPDDPLQGAASPGPAAVVGT